MKYTMTFESDDAEKDLDKVVNTIMSAVEKYFKISKENEPEKVTCPDDVEKLKADIHGMDNRIDGLEGRLDSFMEVDVKKRVEAKK